MVLGKSLQASASLSVNSNNDTRSASLAGCCKDGTSPATAHHGHYHYSRQLETQGTPDHLTQCSHLTDAEIGTWRSKAGVQGPHSRSVGEPGLEPTPVGTPPIPPVCKGAPRATHRKSGETFAPHSWSAAPMLGDLGVLGAGLQSLPTEGGGPGLCPSTSSLCQHRP